MPGASYVDAAQLSSKFAACVSIFTKAKTHRSGRVHIFVHDSNYDYKKKSHSSNSTYGGIARLELEAPWF